MLLIDVEEIKTCFPEDLFPSRIYLSAVWCMLICAVLFNVSLNTISGETGGHMLEQCQEKSSSV